jgi:hypothetical protein
MEMLYSAIITVILWKIVFELDKWKERDMKKQKFPKP